MILPRLWIATVIDFSFSNLVSLVLELYQSPEVFCQLLPGKRHLASLRFLLFSTQVPLFHSYDKEFDLLNSLLSMMYNKKRQKSTNNSINEPTSIHHRVNIGSCPPFSLCPPSSSIHYQDLPHQHGAVQPKVIIV